MSLTENISSSTPIASEMNAENSADRLGANGGIPTDGTLTDSILDQSMDLPLGEDLSQSDSDDKNLEHETGNESTTDNDSLFNALKSQSKENAAPFKSMLKDLLEGFNHQLRLEIRTDMKQLLETNKRELSDFKTQIETKISGLDCKIDSSVSDMNSKIDTLLDRVNNSDSPISEEKMAKIDNAISLSNTLSDRLDSHIKSTKSNFTEQNKKETDMIQSLEFLSKEVQELREANKALTQKTEKLEIALDNQGTHCKRLKTQFNSLAIEKTASDVRQRKLNLVFDGIKESKNDNPKQLVIDLLQKTGVLPNATDIDIAYRLGRSAEGTTRPILVSFHNQAVKDNILTRANKIKQISGNTLLWINRDLPEITRRQTANTRRCFNLMKANKHECMVHGTSITYKKKVYHYKDLNTLPAGSRLEDTRQVPCENGTGICFQSELSYLSSFFPAPVVYRNKEFVSAEQAFQWTRATHAGKTEIANDILMNEDPYVIKKLGEEAGDSDPWKLIDIDTLRTITHLKFKQNRRLGERLRTTDYTKFYECTANLKWGTGVHLPYSREIDVSTFTGSNHLGLIIADVKARLINDHLKIVSHSTTSTST